MNASSPGVVVFASSLLRIVYFKACYCYFRKKNHVKKKNKNIYLYIALDVHECCYEWLNACFQLK